MFFDSQRPLEYFVTSIRYLRAGQYILFAGECYRVHRIMEQLEEHRFSLVLREPILMDVIEFHNLSSYQEVLILKEK